MVILSCGRGIWHTLSLSQRRGENAYYLSDNATIGVGKTETAGTATMASPGTKIIRPLAAVISGSALLAYIYVRMYSIIDNGGFSAPHYEGFSVDLLATISPIMISLLVFCIGFLISSPNISDALSKFSKSQTAYDYAIADLRDRLAKSTTSRSDIEDIKRILADLQGNLSDNVSEKLQETLESIKETVNSEEISDILELMLKNMAEINEYFKISKRHARSSFKLAYMTCIVGIIMAQTLKRI